MDLIQWARDGGKGRVKVFPNLDELRAYTVETRKYFHLSDESEETGNVVLKHLLRPILRYR